MIESIVFCKPFLWSVQEIFVYSKVMKMFLIFLLGAIFYLSSFSVVYLVWILFMVWDRDHFFFSPCAYLIDQGSCLKVLLSSVLCRIACALFTEMVEMRMIKYRWGVTLSCKMQEFWLLFSVSRKRSSLSPHSNWEL